MRRAARIAGLQLLFPGCEEFEGAEGSGQLVAQVVRPAAIGVQVAKMLSQAAREQPAGHVEIFIVMGGQPAGVTLGVFHGTPVGRQGPRYLEFGW
jgi:hypothetical protein